MKYNELINNFLNNEVNFNFNKINGLMYSQLRFFLFRKIQSKLLKTNNKSSRNIKIGFKFLYLEFLSILLIIIKLPFFVFRKNKIFYAEHGRYINYKNKFIDPYSFMSQNIDIENKNSLIRVGTIKNSYSDLNIKEFNHIFISVYFIHFLSCLIALLLSSIIFIFFINFYFTLKRNDFFKQYINIKLFVKFSIVFSRNLLSLLILFIIRPKNVKVVDAYNFNSSFIVTANILNIDTFEFQHGMISSQHIAYNYNFNKSLKEMFLPKYIYLWSKGWSKFIPIIKENSSESISWTYEYFYEIFKNQKKEASKDIDILVIGQPSIQNEMINIVNYLFSRFGNKRIYYKMHPKEINFNIEANINIVKDELYSLLLRSKVVIGGFSTVLLESKAMNIETISLKSITPDEYLNVLSSFDIRTIDNESQITEDILLYNSSNVNNSPINLKNIVKEKNE